MSDALLLLKLFKSKSVNTCFHSYHSELSRGILDATTSCLCSKANMASTGSVVEERLRQRTYYTHVHIEGDHTILVHKHVA